MVRETTDAESAKSIRFRGCIIPLIVVDRLHKEKEKPPFRRLHERPNRLFKSRTFDCYT